MSEEVKFKSVLIKSLKILGIIYCITAVSFAAIVYFANTLDRPYHKRQIPAEITPWLK